MSEAAIEGYVCPRCGFVDVDEFPRGTDDAGEGLLLCGKCPADDAYEAHGPLVTAPEDSE